MGIEENQQINRAMAVVPPHPQNRSVGTIDGTFMVTYDFDAMESRVYLQGELFAVIPLITTPPPTEEGAR